MADAASNKSVFRAIADPTRRAILDLLSGGEQPVLALAGEFAMSQPAISQHLKVLAAADLVRIRKLGRQRLYRLHAQPLREVRDWAAYFESFWDKKLDALGAFLEELE